MIRNPLTEIRSRVERVKSQSENTQPNYRLSLNKFAYGNVVHTTKTEPGNPSTCMLQD